MKSVIKYIFCVFIALTLLLTSCLGGSSPGEPSSNADGISSAVAESSENPQSSAESSESEPRYLRSEYYFKDLAYKEPDFDAIYIEMDEITSLYDSTADAEVIKKEFEYLADLMREAETEYGLLSILQSLDTADSDIADEMVILAENFTEAQKRYYALADTLLDSYCAETVFAGYSEEEKAEIRANALLFDDEYVILAAKLADCENKYIDNLSLTIYADGEEMTLREVKDTYGYDTYLKGLNYVGGEIYLDIVETYKTITAKAGYKTYADYAYANNYYRDYDPSESARLHEYVKEYIVPLYAELSKNVSYYNKSSSFDSHPFDYEKVLINYFSTVSDDMADAYEYLREFGLYSIDDSAKKQSGAYTAYLNSYDVPFIFERTSGNYSDIQTFIHEFGHFYAYYLHGGELPFMIDVDEIHSQANELLFLPCYGVIYSENVCETIERYELNSNLGSIISGCLFDEFEQAVFAGDYDSVEELNALFASICAEYKMNIPEYGWVRIQHLFLYPFYYISYAVSLVPSLEIYAASLENRAEGVAMYNALLATSVDCGGFMDLMEKSGFANPFEEQTILKIADIVEEIVG